MLLTVTDVHLLACTASSNMTRIARASHRAVSLPLPFAMRTEAAAVLALGSCESAKELPLREAAGDTHGVALV